MAKYALAIAMSFLSAFLMWLGEERFEAARIEAGSTFEIPTLTILGGTALFILAGAAFSVVLMIRAKRDRRFGYLATAAIVPLLIVAIPYLWYEGVFGLQSWLLWIESPFVQGASSFATGAVAANLMWRVTGHKRFEESV